MSQLGRMREMQPLLPWRPAILSPTERFFLSTRYTRTLFTTPPSFGRSSNSESELSTAASASSAKRGRNGAMIASILSATGLSSIW